MQLSPRTLIDPEFVSTIQRSPANGGIAAVLDERQFDKWWNEWYEFIFHTDSVSEVSTPTSLIRGQYEWVIDASMSIADFIETPLFIDGTYAAINNLHAKWAIGCAVLSPTNHPDNVKEDSHAMSALYAVLILLSLFLGPVVNDEEDAANVAKALADAAVTDALAAVTAIEEEDAANVAKALADAVTAAIYEVSEEVTKGGLERLKRFMHGRLPPGAPALSSAASSHFVAIPPTDVRRVVLGHDAIRIDPAASVTAARWAAHANRWIRPLGHGRGRSARFVQPMD
jgi:hypothetical protein